MPVNPAPSPRWFQFTFSTWLVLVAILAWGMVEGRWVVRVTEREIGFYAGTVSSYQLVTRSVNPVLRYPALALAAFVGWKAAWLIAERRRAK